MVATPERVARARHLIATGLTVREAAARVKVGNPLCTLPCEMANRKTTQTDSLGTCAWKRSSKEQGATAGMQDEADVRCGCRINMSALAIHT